MGTWGKGHLAIVSTVAFFMMPACMHVVCKNCTNTTSTDRRASLNYAPNELLVTFKPGTDPSRIKDLNDSLHVQVLKSLLGGRLNLVRISADRSLAEIRHTYSSFPEVESVGLNYKAVTQ